MGTFYVEKGEDLIYWYHADHGIEALAFQILSAVEPTAVSDQNAVSRGRESTRRNKFNLKISLTQV